MAKDKAWIFRGGERRESSFSDDSTATVIIVYQLSFLNGKFAFRDLGCSGDG
jgi:hypothetical protein